MSPRLRKRTRTLQPTADQPRPAIGIPQRTEPALTGQPAVTVVEISDPTIASEGVEFFDLDAVQLTTTPFRARRVIARLEGGAVVHQSTRHRVRTRTKSQPGLLAYVAFGPRTKGTVNGLPIRPEQMLAVEAETEVVFVPESGYESITLLLPPEEIRAHLIVRRRETDFWLPHGVETLQAEPAVVRRLFDWGKRLAGTAARRPALFNERKEARIAARIEMVEMLLSTLGAARSFEPARSGKALQSHSLIVSMAEDYALSHTDDRVYVSDLCRAAGVSERALEYAFKQVMGLTPMAHLTRLRLHRVRRALLAATHGSTTVSAAALDWGFWHFGDFSRAFKSCFGELPSETLRRAKR